MQLSDIGITRRKLLAAGGTGVLGMAGATRVASNPVTYSQSTLVENGDLDLRVDWKEWYNGTVLERQDTPTDPSGPVLRIENVVPGDAGKLAIGLTPEEGEDGPSRTRLMMRIRRLAAGTENGITEPERKAGDTTPGAGELGANLDTTVWYDEGFTVAGTPIYGRCDGAFDPVTDTELISGPFTVVSVPPTSTAWLELDAHPDGSEDCLAEDEALCLGLEWAVPDDVGNRIQTDAVTFAIEFRAEGCENG